MSDFQLSNSRYLQKLGSVVERDEVVLNTKRFMRRKIRELSFLDKHLPAESVDQSACQVNVNHRQPSYIVESEPDSEAFVIGWKSATDYQYVSGDFAELAFFPIESQHFQIDEKELLVYKSPITKIIQDNTVRDIHRAKDSYWANLCYGAAVRTGQNVSTAATTFAKSEFIKVLQPIDRQELAAAAVLMAKPKYNELAASSFNDFGSDLVGDATVNGYRYKTYMGHALMVTTKSDLLTRNPQAVNVVSIGPSVESPVLSFKKIAPAKKVPVDPFYTIGTNLQALPIGGNATLYGFYSAVVLINGYFVSGTSDAGAFAAATHTVGGVAPTGSTAGYAAVATNPGLDFTTQRWLGNTIIATTRPNYLGKHLLLKDIDFWIKQEDFIISWKARMIMGLGLLNANSVATLTFA